MHTVEEGPAANHPAARSSVDSASSICRNATYSGAWFSVARSKWMTFPMSQRSGMREGDEARDGRDEEQA